MPSRKSQNRLSGQIVTHDKAGRPAMVGWGDRISALTLGPSEPKPRIVAADGNTAGQQRDYHKRRRWPPILGAQQRDEDDDPKNPAAANVARSESRANADLIERVGPGPFMRDVLQRSIEYIRRKWMLMLSQLAFFRSSDSANGPFDGGRNGKRSPLRAHSFKKWRAGFPWPPFERFDRTLDPV